MLSVDVFFLTIGYAISWQSQHRNQARVGKLRIGTTIVAWCASVDEMFSGMVLAKRLSKILCVLEINDIQPRESHLQCYVQCHAPVG
jgi:hypothetical protein